MLKIAGNKFKALLLGMAAIGFLGGSINAVAASIDTYSLWDQANSTNAWRPWGTPNTATYGQLLTTQQSMVVSDFSFYVKPGTVDTVNFKAYVYSWDDVNHRIQGSPLFSSGALTSPNSPSVFTRVMIQTGTLSLAANQKYVFFFTTSGETQVNPNATYYVAGYSFSGDIDPNVSFAFYNNGSDFSLLSSHVWDAWGRESLAFLLNYSTFLPDTQSSLQVTSNTLRGFYSIAGVAMNNNLNNDCTLFDKYGICTSLGGTQNSLSGGLNNDSTSGTLTVAYRVNDAIRIGGYLDQTLNINNNAIVHLNNASPAFGVFAVWNEHVDGYGAQLRVAAGYDDKDMTITRQVIGSSEAGTGKTNLTSYGASVVGSYVMLMPGDITFSPYAGLRYTKVKAGAYAESDSVADPLTYTALTKNETTALIGAKWSTRITDNAIAYASLGIEQDLKNNGGTYSATGVDGLTSIAFNPDISRTRRTASIGSYYNLGDTQRIGANLAWSEQAFTSIDATSLMVTYTAGF